MGTMVVLSLTAIYQTIFGFTERTSNKKGIVRGVLLLLLLAVLCARTSTQQF